MDITQTESYISDKEKLNLKKWDYEMFKTFLLSQARGQEFLLPLDQFPQEIELNEFWHKILNLIRDKTTQDEIERVALIGHNLTQRSLYLPSEDIAEVPWQSEKHAPVADIAIQRQKGLAISKGAEGIVGILHSHPPHDINILNFKLKTGRLSAGDLYAALKTAHGPLVGVADGEINSIAVKTKDSIDPKDSHDKFYDLWEGEPQPKNLDILLAQKYKIALFKGPVNKPLKRVA